MRTADTTRTGARWSQIRVTIGAVDVTNYDGRNWVVSADWSTDVDAATGSAVVMLHPEEQWLKWAPLRDDSKPNAVAPVLTLGEIVTISVSEAITRAAADAGLPAWHEVFRGRIIELDWAAKPIRIQCADISVDLAAAWLMRERWYGRGHRPEGTLVWVPDLDVTAGEYCIESKGEALSSVWRCTTSGTTGTTEPTWAMTPVTDGTAEWEQVVLGSSVWTTSTAFALGDYVLSRRAVATVWAASTAYSLNDTVLRNPATVHRYLCTQAGTTSGAQPDWTTLAVGQELTDGACKWLRLTDDRANNSELDRFMCVVAGTSASDYGYEPNWPVTDGLTCDEATGVRWTKLKLTEDGLLPVESIMQGMIADATRDNSLTAPPPIHCPTATGYWVRPFLQSPMSCLEAMRRQIAQIGWTIRLKYVSYLGYHAVWGKWRLVLEEPARTGATAGATWTEADYYAVRRGSVKLSEIRNRIEATWTDWEDLQADGKNPKVKRVLNEDAASIAKYGVRFMSLGLGTANELNTYAEAIALVSKILSDLCEPTAEVEIDAPMHWELELNDVLELSPGRCWYEAQSLAVVGLRHSFKDGKARSAVSVRGKPTAGVRVWLEREARPGGAAPAVHVFPQAPETVDVTSGINSATITVTPPLTGAQPRLPGGFAESAELHLSETNGFTPSAATLIDISRAFRFDLTGLRAGTTYYGRIVMVDGRGNRSAPSPQFTLQPWGQRGAQLSLSSDDSVEGGAGQVAFDTADVDIDSWQDGDSIVVPDAGVYRLHAEGRVTGLGTGETAGWVFKSGTTTIYAAPAASVGEDGAAAADCIVELDADTAVEAHLAAPDTVTVKAGATFSVLRMLIER